MLIQLRTRVRDGDAKNNVKGDTVIQSGALSPALAKKKPMQMLLSLSAQPRGVQKRKTK